VPETALDLSQNDFSFDFQNERVQPFVGPSTANLVHPRSMIASGTTGTGTGGSARGSTRQSNPLSRLMSGSQFQGQNQGLRGFSTTGNTGVPRRGIRGAVQYTFSAANRQTVSANVPTSFIGRIQQTPQFQGLSSISITMENRVATLSGTVADSEQRSLLERQLMLEPGVSSVVNQLQIQQE
jgi:hypothetical protein